MTSASALPTSNRKPRSPSGEPEPQGPAIQEVLRPVNAAYFGELARYNAWANERLYAACGELADTERKAPRPAFFGSIHRTLNHLLVGDRVWLSRLAGEAHGIASLDQELYEDF